MNTIRPLAAELLARRTDPTALDFETTAELPDLDEPIGQDRFVEAVRFGAGVGGDGFNTYAMGPTGVGKHQTIRALLEERAAGAPAPSDWCYINDFADPYRPIAIELPAGHGRRLRQDMQGLVEALLDAIPAAFESQEYQQRISEVSEEVRERQEHALEELGREVTDQGLRLLRTPGGFAFAPVREGEVIGPEDFAKLPDEEQEKVQAAMGSAQDRMQQIMRDVIRWTKDSREQVKEYNREITLSAAADLVDHVREKYTEHPEVVSYLDAVLTDIADNCEQFRRTEGGENPAGLPLPTRAPSFERYSINLIVDNSAATAPPVFHEENPSYHNLIGRVDHQSEFGTVKTDFSLIKPGALHRANGGYLILDARRLLSQPFAWEALKGALRSAEIRIESPGQAYSLMSTVSIEPEPIPLCVKIVLVGERYLYYLLCEHDQDFRALFKVAADFEDRVDRSADTELLYARLIAGLARAESLRHFDRAAVARVVDRAARIQSDAEKLSTHMGAVGDLVREASHWAGEAEHEVATAADVERAIEAGIRRSDRMRAHFQEEIQRGTVLIDTDGERLGQINGLSVLALGDFTFGQPTRITATTRMGNGQVVDIEREVKLGGPTHSKGVLILSSFLAERFGSERPLAFAASLAFEQSYAGVDGDSASVAELCLLLSVLAGVPIRQSVAVTGSINQHGRVQPIGGVNEKIEGFFDVCAARGLTGDQGVAIPEANKKHLMLRDDVVEAAREGRFHIWPLTTVDDALEVLTGVPAGERGPDGAYPAASVNGRAEARLTELRELRRQHGRRAGDNGSDEPDRRDDEQ